MSPLLPLFHIAEAGKFRRRKCRESVRGINGVVLDLYDPYYCRHLEIGLSLCREVYAAENEPKIGVNLLVVFHNCAKKRKIDFRRRTRYMQKGKMKEQAITVDNDDGSDEEESEYACVRVIGRRYLEAVCCWIMNEFTTAKLQSAPPPPSPPIDIPFISLISVIEANREVLDKYKICRRWNFWLAPYFQRKLDEEYQSLQRDCSIQMQTQIARDLKRVLYKLSSDDDDRNSLRSESISSRESKRIRTQTFKGDLEIFPEFTVGLDGPVMKELKSKLLHGDEQVLNLYGLAGSGKTTLAKNFVMVPKSKLKNIFFVTLGSQFRGDEAINDLQDRLPEFGANLVLLVLDDVWPASEKIVEEFRVQMSTGSKIFVTSRVPVTRLGIRFPMEQLSEDDAVAIFLHFVQQSNIDFDSRYGSSLWGQCRGLLFKVWIIFIGREILPQNGFEDPSCLH
ncbi:hypothetical protein K1719_043189 [Acacia pycnantha]|nr:hypothetical protein K1719_043189 [Acacia pycnantha]